MNDRLYGLDKLYSVYDKYSKYDYIYVDDISNYKIKRPNEFEASHGGICLDYMRPMSLAMHKNAFSHQCYFTELHKDNKTIATHTYIIVNDFDFYYWVECAWQKHKGVYLVFSYKDVERILRNEYDADECYTVVYSPVKTEGMTADEFFKYLNNYGIKL